MTLSPDEQQLIDTAKKVSLTRALVFKSDQLAFERLLRTVKFDFPEIFIVYKATSSGKLCIQHESEAQGNEHKF